MKYIIFSILLLATIMSLFISIPAVKELLSMDLNTVSYSTVRWTQMRAVPTVLLLMTVIVYGYYQISVYRINKKYKTK